MRKRLGVAVWVCSLVCAGAGGPAAAGLAYERVGPPPAATAYGTVAVDPREPGRWHWFSRGRLPTRHGGGGDQGFFGTGDGGLSWRQEAGVAPSVNAGNGGALVHPQRPDRVVAVCEWQPNLWVSEDAGRSWAGREAPYKHGICVASDPRDPEVLYVGSDDGVWRSRDGGRAWEPLEAGLPGEPPVGVSNTVSALAVDPQDPDTVYAAYLYADPGSPWGVYRSRDGGDSWEPANRGLPETARELDFSKLKLPEPKPGQPAMRLADLGVVRLQHRAADGLLAWSERSGVAGGSGASGASGGAGASGGSGVSGGTTLLVSTRESGLFRSEDGAGSWRRVGPPRWEEPGGGRGAKATGLAAHPGDPSFVYAATDRLSLHVSADGGRTWAFLGRLAEPLDGGGWRLPGGEALDAAAWEAAPSLRRTRAYAPRFVPGSPRELLVPTDAGLLRVSLPGHAAPAGPA